MTKKPRKPWNEQTQIEKVKTVFTFLVGLAFLVACGYGIVSAVIQDRRDNIAYDAQMNATATAQAATETIQALTPTATPTLTQQITAIVKNHPSDDGVSRVNGTITGASVAGSDYRVDVKEGEAALGAAFARGEIQRDAYAVLDALYASDFHPTSVTVRVFGPVMDQYGNTSIGQWAVAFLTRQTEKKFNWKGLTYRSAWAVYDQAEYLVNGLCCM